MIDTYVQRYNLSDQVASLLRAVEAEAGLIADSADGASDSNGLSLRFLRDRKRLLIVMKGRALSVFATATDNAIDCGAVGTIEISSERLLGDQREAIGYLMSGKFSDTPSRVPIKWDFVQW